MSMSFKRFRALAKRHFIAMIMAHRKNLPIALKLRGDWCRHFRDWFPSKMTRERLSEDDLKRECWTRYHQNFMNELFDDQQCNDHCTVLRRIIQQIFHTMDGYRNFTSFLSDYMPQEYEWFHDLTGSPHRHRISSNLSYAYHNPTYEAQLMTQITDLVRRVEEFPVTRCMNKSHKSFGKPISECKARSCVVRQVLSS
jgi:hypothetical protein